MNNSWMVFRDELRATSVCSATKVFHLHLISIDTNWFTLAYKLTSAQHAPNHLGRRVISSCTSWFTLELKPTSAQHALNHLRWRVISRNTSLSTLALKRTSARFAPNHLGRRVISSCTSWLTATFGHFSAPFVRKCLKWNSISKIIFKECINSKTTLIAVFIQQSLFPFPFFCRHSKV